MKIGRRGFLKLLGGTAAAAVAAPIIAPAKSVLALPTAPLFVPSRNLDFGVPRRIVSAESVTATDIKALWEKGARQWQAVKDTRPAIPMLLRQSEYLPRYGGKLAAGSEVLVDHETADRWVRNHIAVPGPSAPRDLQERSAKRLAEREQERAAPSTIWGIPVVESSLMPDNTIALVAARPTRSSGIDVSLSSVYRSDANRRLREILRA